MRRHSLHAIASQLSPVPGCTGIELLEADTFNLHCFQTLTGTKFLLVVEPNASYIPLLLQRCDWGLRVLLRLAGDTLAVWGPRGEQLLWPRQLGAEQ